MHLAYEEEVKDLSPSLEDALINEAMISAGENALLSVLGGAASIFWSPRAMAILVYQAMKAEDC